MSAETERRGVGPGGRAGADAGPGTGPGAGRNRGARSGKQDKVLYRRNELDGVPAASMVFFVDDTDDLSGDSSTGYVAECIAEAVVALGGNVHLGITRHQLLLAEGVPYTSHNSAMGFEAAVPLAALDDCRRRAVELVESMSVAGSDPGLAIAVLPTDAMALVSAVAALQHFGQRAQQVVCTKEEAYELAASVPWLSLTEHGGTGQGVIGALAGMGLRLGGNDGRFRGKWNLCQLLGSEAPMSAESFRATLSALAGGAVDVMDRDQRQLESGERVLPVREAKPVLWRGRLTFVVEPDGDCYVPAEKVDLGRAGMDESWNRVCERFTADNDIEECGGVRRAASEGMPLPRTGAGDGQRSCRNCLYRRWTDRGFTCVAGMSANP